MTVEDKYVRCSSLRLHYLDFGGDGEIVVALHGYVQNAHAFDGVAAVLVPKVRLLALDLRGRGGSDWGPPDCYRWVYYLSDLRAFIQAVGATRFALLGTSMGGMVAMLYAMAHPGEVTRLVLNDHALNLNRAGVIRAGQRIRRAPPVFETIAHAVAWFTSERDGLEHLDPANRRAWVSHFLTPTDGGLRFNCDPAIIRRAGLVPPQAGPRVPWSHRWTVWEQAKRLQMPVLILRGADSDVVPRESARRLVEFLPRASCVEVAAVGHAPTLYEADAQMALREFLVEGEA